MDIIEKITGNVSENTACWNAVESAIEECGVDIPEGTPKTDYADKVSEVFEAGKKSEYDAFWDAFQQNGNRTIYNGLFMSHKFEPRTWFKPKYNIVPTSLYMFTYMAGSDVGNTDFVELFNDVGVEFDTSKCTDFQYAFAVGKRFGVIDARAARGLDTQFMFNNYYLQTVDELIVKETTTYNNLTFYGCSNLTKMIVTGTIGQNGFDVHWSTNLNRDSIESIVNALSTTTTGLSITLSSIAVTNAFGGVDSEEWQALVASKPNWTISLV